MWWSRLRETFVDTPIRPTWMLWSWAPMLPPLPQVQQRCQDLERMLQGQALPAPQQAWLRSGMATNPVSGQAQPSVMCPMAAASPRSSHQP